LPILTPALFLAALAVLATPPAHAGISPASACKNKKLKASGKYHLNQLTAFGRNKKKRNTARLLEDLSRAQSRLAKGFTQAEWFKNGGARGCQTTGDVAVLRSALDSQVTETLALVCLGSPSTTTLIPTTTTLLPSAGSCEGSGAPCGSDSDCDAIGACDNLTNTATCTQTCGDCINGMGCFSPHPLGGVCFGCLGNDALCPGNAVCHDSLGNPGDNCAIHGLPACVGQPTLTPCTIPGRCVSPTTTTTGTTSLPTTTTLPP
jgi:hypothetical protein